MSTRVIILPEDEFETLLASIEVIDEEDAKFRELISDRSFILGEKLIGDAADESVRREIIVECAAEIEAAGCSRTFPCYFSGKELRHDHRCPIALANKLRETL